MLTIPFNVCADICFSLCLRIVSGGGSETPGVYAGRQTASQPGPDSFTGPLRWHSLTHQARYLYYPKHHHSTSLEGGGGINPPTL